MKYIFTLTLGRNHPEGEVSDKQLQAFLKLVSQKLEGFQITHSEGFWKREQERSFSIIVAGDAKLEKSMREISSLYKSLYKQEATILEKRKSGKILFL